MNNHKFINWYEWHFFLKLNNQQSTHEINFLQEIPCHFYVILKSRRIMLAIYFVLITLLSVLSFSLAYSKNCRILSITSYKNSRIGNNNNDNYNRNDKTKLG